MSKKYDFHGKTILVTGASMGIGRQVVEMLAERGANLILVANTEDLLRELCQQLRREGQEISYEYCDFFDSAEIERLIRKVSAHSHLDGLIHCAGMGMWGKIVDVSLEEVRRLYQLNLFSILQLTQGLFPLLKRGDAPRIVTVSSIASWVGSPGFGIYAATKASINAVTNALRVECAVEGIKVINIYPGQTRTNFLDNTKNIGWKIPLNPAGGQSAEFVAKKIVRAYQKGSREAFVVWTNRLLMYGGFFFPRLMDWGLKGFYKSSFSEKHRL